MINKRKKNPIRFILFDWAGVFCAPGEPFVNRQLQKSLKLNPAQIEDQVKDVQNEYYRGKISATKFWRQVLGHFKLTGLSIPDLTASYLQSYKLYPSMLKLAQKLKKNYRVGLVSNLTNEMMMEILTRHQIKKIFSVTVFSNKIGYLKPEPEIFNLALKKLGAHPKETLFVDDSETNVKAAQKMGMATILATTPSKTLKDIQKTLTKFN